MRPIFPGAIIYAVFFWFAVGSNAYGVSGDGDPMSLVFNMVTGFGGIGAFIIFFILDRKAENKRRDADRAAENKRRDEDRARWRQVDQELVDLVRKCTSATSEATGVLTELRKDICRLAEANGHRGLVDCDRLDKN